MGRGRGRLDFKPNITLKSSADLEPKENSNGMFGGSCCTPIIMISDDEEEFEPVTETHVELPSPQSVELSSGSSSDSTGALSDRSSGSSSDDVVFLEYSSNDDLYVHDDSETSPAMKRSIDAEVCTRNYVHKKPERMDKRIKKPVIYFINLELDESDRSVINYVLDSCLSQREVLVDFGTNHAMRHDLSLLKPTGWLTGCVIDVFVSMLTLREMSKGSHKRNCFLPTTYSQLILAGRSSVDELLFKFRVASSYLMSASECEKLYIPMNCNNDHWLLLVYDFPKQSILLLDTHPSPMRKRMRDTIAQKVIEFSKDLFPSAGLGVGSHSLSDFKFRKPRWVQRQKNGYDCGVHVIQYMESSNLEELWNSRCDSDELRSRLIVELALAEENKFKHELKLKIEEYDRKKRALP